MKKNLLYLLMFLAMPLAFVACGDDEDGDNNNNNGITTPINATGEYDGDIEIFINGENFFQTANPDITSSPVSFTTNVGYILTQSGFISINFLAVSIHFLSASDGRPTII